MNNWIKKTIIVGLVIGLGQVSVDARFLDLKKQKKVPVNPILIPKLDPPTEPIPSDSSYNTEKNNKNISLRFENLALVNVLLNIQVETGISFSIDPEMETFPFSATVQAENWETAIKELLKDFSRIEVWTENLDTSRIWLYRTDNSNQRLLHSHAVSPYNHEVPNQ